MKTRRNEASKELSAGFVFKFFGMPLHADLPSGFRVIVRDSFDRLDHAVRAMAHRAMGGAEGPNSLMVEAIHRLRTYPEQALEPAPGLHCKRMALG